MAKLSLKDLEAKVRESSERFNDERATHCRRVLITNITILMSAKDITIAELAIYCSVPNRSIRNILDINGPDPLYTQLCKVAYALNEPVSRLVEVAEDDEHRAEAYRIAHIYECSVDAGRRIIKTAAEAAMWKTSQEESRNRERSGTSRSRRSGDT